MLRRLAAAFGSFEKSFSHQVQQVVIQDIYGKPIWNLLCKQDASLDTLHAAKRNPEIMARKTSASAVRRKWPQGTTSKTPLTRLRASQWRPQTPASVSGKEQKCYDWNTSYVVISSISTMLQYARIEYNWFAIVKYTHEATYGLTIALWWGLSWKVRWCTEARSLHCTRAGTDDIHKVPALVCVCLPALNLYKLASWKNPISL